MQKIVPETSVTHQSNVTVGRKHANLSEDAFTAGLPIIINIIAVMPTLFINFFWKPRVHKSLLKFCQSATLVITAEAFS